jgi:hypothetical protein
VRRVSTSCLYILSFHLASPARLNTESAFGIVTLASLFPVLSVQLLAFALMAFRSAADVSAHSSGAEAWWERSPVKEVLLSLRAVVPLAGALFLIARVVLSRAPLTRSGSSTELQLIDSSSADYQIASSHSQEDLSSEPDGPPIDTSVNWVQIGIGFGAAQLGMILFNFGLRYGLEPLAQQVGSLLPGAYKQTAALPKSPLYSYPVEFPFHYFLSLILL